MRADGRPPEGIAYGPDGFAEFADKPEEAAIFNQSMVDNSRRFAAEAAAAYDFGRFSTIMDVGGGYGAVLATLLAAAPQAAGCVLDLGHAEEGARALFEKDGVRRAGALCHGELLRSFPRNGRLLRPQIYPA